MANSKQWRMINRLRIGSERRYTRLFRTVLNKQIIPVMKSLEDFGINTTIEKMPYIITEASVTPAYTKLYTDVGVNFARLTSNGIASQKNEDTWLTFMRGFVGTKLTDRISSVTQTSRDQAIKIIQDQLQLGVEEGLGIPEISRNIKKAVPKEWQLINKFRAQRIAQTEVISASNAGSLNGAQSTGLPLNKIWLAGGANIRAAHASADGESVPMGDMFQNTGEPMEYPGDFRGSPENVINCKCAIAYETIVI